MAAAGAGHRSASQAASTCVDNPVITLGASAVALGGTLHVSGTGWCNGTAGGSVLAFKLDAGAIARTDISVHANKTIWAIVGAEDDGSFSADLTMPDGTQTGSAGSTPAAVVGGAHSFTILTGSLKTGDPGRSVVTTEFAFLAAGTEADDPEVWGMPLTAGSAKVWVQRSVSTTEGTLRIAGSGWTTSTGGPSTIAVKLNASDSSQFQRSRGIEESDPTIWAMGRAKGTGEHEFIVNTDGSFDAELDLPAGLTSGQYLTVRLASGKFGAGDVQRSVLSSLLSVDGAAYAAAEDGADVTCRPSTPSATLSVATPTVPLGGTVVVTGTGWCDPAGGGSRMGVKIDEGGYSHLDGHVHTNRTIWAIVQADHATGTFTARIALPDGTTATSTPALTNGAHTLRFLSGSLRAGDTIRSLKVDFVVGTYQPNGSPDPVVGSALLKSNKRGVKVAVRGHHRLRVTVPGSPAGTWVFLSAYVADGSPRYPWSDRWLRLDSRHGVTVKIPSTAPSGAVRLVVQSGEQGVVGQLLGWARVTLRSAVSAASSSSTSSTSSTSGTSVSSTTLTSLLVPARPAATYAALKSLPRRGSTALVDGTVATLTFPAAEPGDTVFFTVYRAGQVLPGGWVTLDADRRATVDLAALGEGTFRIAGQGADTALVGWSPVRIGEGAEDSDAGDAATDPAESSADTSADSGADSGDAAISTPLPRPRQAADSSFVTAMDGWLLGLGALVLAGTGVFLRLRKPGA